jgi:hypothetical protein
MKVINTGKDVRKLDVLPCFDTEEILIKTPRGHYRLFEKNGFLWHSPYTEYGRPIGPAQIRTLLDEGDSIERYEIGVGV